MMTDLSQVFRKQGLQGRKAEEQQLLVPGTHCRETRPPTVFTCNHTQPPFSPPFVPLH